MQFDTKHANICNIFSKKNLWRSYFIYFILMNMIYWGIKPKSLSLCQCFSTAYLTANPQLLCSVPVCVTCPYIFSPAVKRVDIQFNGQNSKFKSQLNLLEGKKSCLFVSFFPPQKIKLAEQNSSNLPQGPHGALRRLHFPYLPAYLTTYFLLKFCVL